MTTSDQEKFLENFFRLVSSFSFDKAKELADKERDQHKSDLGSSWSLIVQAMQQFALVERTYMSLVFLNHKWFARPKENPRNVYTALSHDFSKIKDAQVRSSDERILSHICGQMCDFLMARRTLMDLYEQMTAMSTNRHVDYEDILKVIRDVIYVHRNDFHHPLLSPLKTGFTCECDVVLHLLQAQTLLLSWKFLPSLLELHEAHSKLNMWGLKSTQPVRKSSFGVSSSKSTPVPPLYTWLCKFKVTLVSKFGLYFYEVLSQQTNPADFKSLYQRSPDDFIAKITSFHKKHDALNTSIILSLGDLSQPYYGSGYRHPRRTATQPQGIECYKAVMSYPQKPEKHWPQIVMLVNTFPAVDKIHHFFDQVHQLTYFLYKIESHIWIFLIFSCKKSEKDSHINNFLLDFVSALRCTKLFASLKPGSK